MSRGSAPVSNRNRERPPSEVDGGYVMIMTALLLIPLVAFTALAIDVSSWYSRATELQRTADAAALSAVIWLPDESKVDSVAADTAEANGFKDAVGNITITVDAKPDMNEVEVCVEDGSVTQFFGAVISQPTSLKRCGTARFDMPLQLGSPLNYFGGDSSSVFYDNQTPGDYATTPPPASDFEGGAYCQVIFQGAVQGYWRAGPPVVFVVDAQRYDIPVCWQGPAYKPIPDSRTLGFWASVHGPGTNASQGDAYSPFCYGLTSSGGDDATFGWSVNCAGNQTNNQYRTDPTRTEQPDYSSGYWYSLDTKEAGTVSLQVFDAAYDPENAQYEGTGDNKLLEGASGDSVKFTTVITIYDADDTPLDMSDNTQAICTTSYTSENVARHTWQEVCAPFAVDADARYYVNVRTYSPGWAGGGGSGMNNYALRAISGHQDANCVGERIAGVTDCWGASGSSQPELSAIGDMAMYNNLPSGTSEFYLAKIRPMYANRTLIIDLWDAGESNDLVKISVLRPTNGSGPNRWEVAPECTWFGREPDSAPGVPGPSGPENASPLGGCTIELTTAGGAAQYNGKWLEIKVPLPDDYGRPGASTACDPDENPVENVDASACWWKIRYYSAGQIHDTTTWSAHIERGPLQLWE